MDLHLVFLGTAGATPTVDRGSSAILVIRGGERILIDCGEGTQRQLMRSAGLARIGMILHHASSWRPLSGASRSAEDAQPARAGRSRCFSTVRRGSTSCLRDAERMMGSPKFPLLGRGGIGRESVLEGCDYWLKAASTAHGLPGLAWCLEEKPRPGLFHPEAAIGAGCGSRARTSVDCSGARR